MSKEMNFRELEYFVEIAREKNLSHAAQKLYVGQPTLTKYMQRLQEQWGIPLFERGTRELKLTYAGERFLSYAQQLLAQKRSLENEMAEIRKMNAGVLKVGMPSVRCSLLLPAVLPVFRERYPKVDFQIIEESSVKLDEALLHGKIDLAFFALCSPLEDLAYEVLREDVIYAVFPMGHPIRERAILCENGELGIELEWIKDETLLVQKPTQRQGEYILRELKEKNISPKKIQEHSNIRAAIALAAEGYGVAFISGSLLRYLKEICSFDAYRLIGAVSGFPFVAAYRKGAFIPDYARDFINLAAQFANS